MLPGLTANTSMQTTAGTMTTHIELRPSRPGARHSSKRSKPRNGWENSPGGTAPIGVATSAPVYAGGLGEAGGTPPDSAPAATANATDGRPSAGKASADHSTTK